MRLTWRCYHMNCHNLSLVSLSEGTRIFISTELVSDQHCIVVFVKVYKTLVIIYVLAQFHPVSVRDHNNKQFRMASNVISITEVIPVTEGTAFVQQNTVANYCGLAMATLAVYEHLITLSQEIRQQEINC
ncbi:hypothetical protein AcV7_002318 [Taiwanofungus camphoratus]|nr:hypothetical protein AcV7_002318 [Antrodia cinnamomea]